MDFTTECKGTKLKYKQIDENNVTEKLSFEIFIRKKLSQTMPEVEEYPKAKRGWNFNKNPYYETIGNRRFEGQKERRGEKRKNLRSLKKRNKLDNGWRRPRLI